MQRSLDEQLNAIGCLNTSVVNLFRGMIIFNDFNISFSHTFQHYVKLTSRGASQWQQQSRILSTMK